jgi:hypothetical protein|nr:MAG TPA: hypothetical protein [Caudoviricetes sp.]
MYELNELGVEPNQKIEKILDDGSTVTLEFEYKENQLGWFFGVKWGDYDYKNIRLTTSYNILRAYRNYLPFGLRCDTQDDEEPMFLTDFATKYATVYLLTREDVQTIEGNYYVKTPTELQS